jgi:hypothetical protein
MAGLQETLASKQLAQANYRNAVVVLGYWQQYRFGRHGFGLEGTAPNICDGSAR